MATKRTSASNTEEGSSGSSTATQLAHAAGSAVVSTFHALNDAEPHYVPGSPYSTIRHTRPWVYYRGVSTVVPISVMGRKPLSEDRKITLQSRGWRTGLFGWTVGGWFGGTIGKEINVTPEKKGVWDIDVDAKKRSQYDKETKEFLDSLSAPKDHVVLETDFVHIPVSSGDGYFRLLIYSSSSSHTPIASTASFRVGSLSLSSAHPRGASVVTLVPELVLKSASVAGNTAAWGAFYTAFPFIKVVEMLPGTHSWGTWAMNRAYQLAGGEETTAQLKERYKVEERRRQAEESMYKNVPFGSIGVRTAYDLENDTKRGKGGIYFPRS